MRFLLAVALCTFVSSTSAQLLPGGSSACDDFWVSMDNQTQLDLYSTCPVFESPVFVGHTFTGAFKLPGIVSIGRVSSGYLLPKLTGSKREDDPVTSISFPDLKNTTVDYFGGVQAMYLNYLTDISFPKLENITGELVLVDNPKLKKAIFPALQAVSKGILIDGDFDEISLPSLQKVAYINVLSTGNLDCVALGKNLSSLIFTATKAPFGGNLGFTCWTGYQTNSWNSSDPKNNNANTPSPSSTSSVPGGSSGSAPTSSGIVSAANATGTSPPPASAANAPNIGLVNVVLALIGTAVIGTL